MCVFVCAGAVLYECVVLVCVLCVGVCGVCVVLRCVCFQMYNALWSSEGLSRTAGVMTLP